MGSSHLIIYIILLVIVTECKEMNRCGIKGTYYSTIINDCVQCPANPSGCTARLNNETLRNCLKNCMEYFQISSQQTDPTTQFVARQIMGERSGVMTAMAGFAVLLLIAGVLVLLVCVCKRRKRSSNVELGGKNWVERRTENPSATQPPSSNLQKEEEGRNNFEEKIVNPLFRPIQENKNISPEIDPKGYVDKNEYN